MDANKFRSLFCLRPTLLSARTMLTLEEIDAIACQGELNSKKFNDRAMSSALIGRGTIRMHKEMPNPLPRSKCTDQ